VIASREALDVRLGHGLIVDQRDLSTNQERRGRTLGSGSRTTRLSATRRSSPLADRRRVMWSRIDAVAPHQPRTTAFVYRVAGGTGEATACGDSGDGRLVER
jgi:hypothetical protein